MQDNNRTKCCSPDVAIIFISSMALQLLEASILYSLIISYASMKFIIVVVGMNFAIPLFILLDGNDCDIGGKENEPEWIKYETLFK